MANIPFVDGNGDSRYLSSAGAGTNGDPFVPSQTMAQPTHDNLNGNANLQVGNTDVGNANPVPVSDAGGVLSVDDGGGALTVDGAVTANQGSHDNLNANANLQIGNVDVATNNPVPVKQMASAYTVWNKYVTSADMSAAAADVTDAPAAGEKICLTGLVVSVGTAMVVTFKEETSGTVVLALDLAAHVPAVVALPQVSPLKLATANKKLQAQASASGAVYITTIYHSLA